MPYKSEIAQSRMMQIVRFIRYYLDVFVEFLYGIYYLNVTNRVPPIKDVRLLWSPTQFAEKIRNGEITSKEVVQMHLDRIQQVNFLLNAVVSLRVKEALAEAEKIDQNIADGVYTKEDFENMPFLGVPFTSKESTHSKGMPITFGLISRKNIVAEDDASIVKNVKATGAILIGVTNVPQINLWYETHNPVYGITKNPYDISRNVGGSSGGEGSIISACGSPMGIGTDIGGSIRIPSYMNGLFGHKTTNLLTPTKGLTFRDGSKDKDTMVCAGPMVRTANDLIPVLKAIIGPPSQVLELDKPVDVRKLKYYFVYDGGDLLTSTPKQEIIEAMEKVVKHYDKTAQVEEIHHDAFKSTSSLYRYWFTKEGNFSFDFTNRTREISVVKEIFKYFIGRSEFSFPALIMFIYQRLPAVDDKWARETTAELTEFIKNKLGDDGVLLYMSSPMPPWYHHMSYSRMFDVSNYTLFSFLRIPCTQVPLGLNKDGLPLGIQVAAAPNMDRLTIAVAKDLEQTFGGHVPPFISN